MDHYRDSAYLLAMELIEAGEARYCCQALYNALCQVTGMEYSTVGAVGFYRERPVDFESFFGLDDSSNFSVDGTWVYAEIENAWWESNWTEPRLRALALALERSR